MAQLGGLDLNGTGLVPIASLVSIWNELHELYARPDEQLDETLSSHQMEQAMRWLSENCSDEMPPTRCPDRRSLGLVSRNYRRKLFDPIELAKMQCTSLDPYDPLSCKNPKRTAKKLLDPVSGGWKEIEEQVELDFKSYRRALDLYLFSELAVGNLMYPVEPGQQPFMTMADKIKYETILQDHGFDPPVKRRMELADLMKAEKTLRTHLMQELKNGCNWKQALKNLAVHIQTTFRLQTVTVHDTKAQQEAEKRQKEVSSLKTTVSQLQNQLKSLQSRTKSQDTGGGNRDQSYGRWKGGKGDKKGKGDNPYLQKDKDGTYYCRRKNMNKEHDEKACKYLHHCNWLACDFPGGRSKCPGAYTHK